MFRIIINNIDLINFVIFVSTFSSISDTVPKGALCRTTVAVYSFTTGEVTPPSFLSFVVSLYVNCAWAETENTGQWTVGYVAQPTKESHETTTGP